MSYSEYLNRLKINSPKVIDTSMRLPDASSFTWRVKMAASSVYRPTDHVITNVSNPSVTPILHQKQIRVYTGSGQGGKVPAASDFITGQSVRALGKDNFNRPKIILGGYTGATGSTCLASPPASQIINEYGNIDGSKTGLNMRHVTDCTSAFTPLTKSYFVDTIPDIKTHKIGVQSKEAWNGAEGTQYGSQNPIYCSTTSTVGNWDDKAMVSSSIHSARPDKLDFVTGPLGPQVSANGEFGRAPKVGDAVAPAPRYAIFHRGKAFPPVPPPGKFVPPAFPAVTHRRM